MMKRLLAYLFIVLGLGLSVSVNANAAKKKTDLWTAIFAHPKAGTSYFSEHGKTKEGALKKTKTKCLKWVQWSKKNKKNNIKYTQEDWNGCKLKKVFFTSDNNFFITELYKGKNIKKIKKNYNLTTERIDKIKKDKYELEQKNLNKYIDILKQGKNLANLYLEKETLISVKNKKLQIENDNIFKYIEELHKGKSLDRFFLENETLAKIPQKKIEIEKNNIDKYLEANLKGSDLREFYLENKTIELVKVKRQERREFLYAKPCTGVIFGHKKGTFKWYKCLEEKEQEELFKGSEIKIVKEDKDKPLKPEKIIKTTSSDNEAPILQVVEVLTVTDPRYSIEGKVTDKGSDKIYLKVDGQDIPINKGKFKINRYSPVDENIKITAIDKWGNEVTKIIKVSVNLESTDIAEALEPLNASKIRSKSSNNKVALIIGIEQYEQSPKATYANLDAKYFYDYATKAFGVKKQNINMLIDQDASLSKTYTALFKWLPGKIKPNKTDLIIFFSGHGLASSDGKEKYILPNNADPDLLSKTALSRNELFDQIVKLKPKSVTMFFDTCYSGVSRDEKTLLASAKPIRIVADESNEIPDNFTIFTASKAEQIASGFEEAKHGIFSYYLMKGLEGKADSNKDKKITNGELLAYMDQNVSERALDLGRQQNPILSGDPDKVLMSYR